MPTIDLSVLGGMLANLGVSLLSYAGIAAILYNIGKLLIRTISWTLDNLLISFIGKFYDYLQQILNGTIFSDAIVKEMMNRVYLIIGVIILFRLGMLFVQYIVNPAQVLEDKGGINSLVKRAIIGLCLMIFIPTIFNIANDLQVAILKDQIIERIVMDEATFNRVQERGKKYGMGRVIGMTIFQGFWNVDKNQIVDKNIIRAYEEAEKKYDPGLVEEAGYGILTESGGKYAFDYFPVLSTAVLAYVLYLMIKYCVDMVLKSFKLLILQIIAPITIVEYIVNGDRNEVFQKWRRSVVANYAMLFVRVFTIWFVAYVSLLMDPKVTGSSATLLNTQDYLLKAIIVLALLAFMMDFPKMLSDIFGLDLEQDSGVKGVLGKISGAAKSVGFGALAVGGAAAMGGFKGAQNSANTRKQLGALNNQLANGQISQSQYNANRAAIMQTHAQNKANIKSATGKSMMKGVTNNSRILGAAFGGANAVSDSIKDKEQKAEEQRYKQELLANAQSTNASTTVIAEQGKRTNLKLDDLIDNTDQTLTQTINIDKKLGTVSGNVDAIAKNTETTAQQTVNMDQKLGKISGNVDAITKNTETTAQQTVNIDQKLGNISGNVDAITKNTETTAQQTVNIDQKLGSISGKVDTIADNTEVSAEQTIDINQKLGNISGDIGNISDNTELTADATLNIEKKVNNQSSNDDIETLNN